MRRSFLPGVLIPLIALSLAAHAAPLPDDPTQKQTDTLVARLVSTNPRPTQDRDGNWTPPAATQDLYMTAEVKTAIEELQKSGPKIFPYLIKYMKDARYCYSTTSSINGPPIPTWYDVTVGSVVMSVLSRYCEGGAGYIHRDSLSGKVYEPNFGNYIHEIGPDKWAHWASNKTRLAIALDFLDWAQKKEEKAGFTDAKQRQWIESSFDKEREDLKKEHWDAQ